MSSAKRNGVDGGIRWVAEDTSGVFSILSHYFNITNTSFIIKVTARIRFNQLITEQEYRTSIGWPSRSNIVKQVKQYSRRFSQNLVFVTSSFGEFASAHSLVLIASIFVTLNCHGVHQTLLSFRRTTNNFWIKAYRRRAFWNTKFWL